MKLHALVIVTVLSGSCIAQTTDTLLYERFETGGATFTLNTADMGSVSAAVGYNQWIINNAYTGGSGQMVCSGLPTTFTVPNTPPQPAGITGNINSYYMHIISDVGQSAGILNCSYLAANGFCGNDENYFTAMTNDVSTLGYDSASVSFLWACAGAASIYGEVYYSINGGAAWTLITAPVSQYNNQPTWTQQTLSLPAFAGQPTLRFGFRFVNQVSFTANDPGFAIDEFLITAKTTAPPPVAAFSVSDSAICETGCVDFTDLSTGNPTSWFWIFQGSTTSFSNQQNPASICYNTPGSYPVTLIVENASGTDTITVTTVTVHANPAQPVITVSGDTLFATPGYSSYEWTLDGTVITGVTGDTLITAGNGVYTVSVSDTNGCTAVSNPFLLNTGLTESATASLNLYPNPSSGIIRYESHSANGILIIYDVSGRAVCIENPNGAGWHQADVSSLAPGYYLVTVTSENRLVQKANLIKL